MTCLDTIATKMDGWLDVTFQESLTFIMRKKNYDPLNSVSKQGQLRVLMWVPMKHSWVALHCSISENEKGLSKVGAKDDNIYLWA